LKGSPSAGVLPFGSLKKEPFFGLAGWLAGWLFSIESYELEQIEGFHMFLK